MTVTFGDYELDAERFELRRRGARVPLEPQAFEVLAYLVTHNDRVVGRQELFEAIWGSSYVSDSALATRIKEARRAVGDDGQAQRLIRTVHGRGYRFVAETGGAVTARAEGASTGGASSSGGAGASAVAAADTATSTGTADGAASRERGAITGRLPVAVTALIGRAAELATLRGLIEQSPLVTVTGPGGVGKTRLAVEVASEVAESYPGGAWFVDLIRTRDPEQVPEVVAQVLGIALDRGADPSRLVVGALSGQPSLLVIDNFEHVIAAAPFVAQLLRETPSRVLVTSRERLRIAGEQVFEAPPLAVESEDARGAPSDAVTLFERIARTIRPDFELNEENRDDVAAICRAVDGLPLAIELAAAQIRLLPPSHLLERLRSRITTLSGGMRDAPERHRTLLDAIAWSFELLSPAEQALLKQLSVFVGGASIEAIEAIEAVSDTDEGEDDPLAGLASLVDQSLLRQQPGRFGEPRFAMLSLVQQFALERLGTAEARDAARRRHAAHFADWAYNLETTRWDADAARWVDAIAQERGNLDAALTWAEETGDMALLARLAAGMQGFWFRESYLADADRWLGLALQATEGLDPLTLGRLYMGMGLLRFGRHDLVGARGEFEQAVAAIEQQDDPLHLPLARMNLAGSYIGSDRYEVGLEQVKLGIEAARDLGLPSLLAYGLNAGGELARVHGDDALAGRWYREALELARAQRDERQQAVMLNNLGFIAGHSGDAAGAAALHRAAIRMCWGVGHRSMVGWTLLNLAGSEHQLGNSERAARIAGAGEGALQALGIPNAPGDATEHAATMHSLEATLGADRMRELQAEGAALPLADAVAEALVE